MRLTVTGAFVRAARSARIAAPYRAQTSTSFPQWAAVSRRHQTTQAATASENNAAFPEQSVPPSQEVDPAKTEEQQIEEDPAAKAFKQRLEKEKPNTVIRDGSLTGAKVSGKPYVFDTTSNLSPSILNLIDRKLYEIPNHPICITRKLIESVFHAPDYINHTVANPVVTTIDNFDKLEFPADHPGRSRTDTYYVDSSHVLRTHTSAHQATAFENMNRTQRYGYTICADVYRRDSIDRSHFPVFHQMEGARCWPIKFKPRIRYELMQKRVEQIKKDIRSIPPVDNLILVEDAASFDFRRNPKQSEHDEQEVRLMATHLKRSLERLISVVFTKAAEAGVGGEEGKGQPLQIRWIEAYFPFTSPSFELEVLWQGEWLELLGCGIVQQPILKKAGLRGALGWAWGLGVERLAMLLFGIPDIRLFWSEDERFLSQFQEGKICKYEPFSKYPACYKDVTFWIPLSPAAASPIEARPDVGVAAAAGGDATKASPAETQPAAFHENDVMEIVRDIGGTLVEDVKLLDEFVHPKTGRKSLCYRINYRSLERTLTNEEVNDLHDRVRSKLESDLRVELR